MTSTVNNASTSVVTSSMPESLLESDSTSYRIGHDRVTSTPMSSKGRVPYLQLLCRSGFINTPRVGYLSGFLIYELSAGRHRHIHWLPSEHIDWDEAVGVPWRFDGSTARRTDRRHPILPQCSVPFARSAPTMIGPSDKRGPEGFMYRIGGVAHASMICILPGVW